MMVLSLRRLPGRLNAEQTAMLLGVTPSDMPILVAAKFLVPLGGKRIALNSPKHFASVKVEEMAGSSEMMERMQIVLTSHWRNRNSSRSAS